MKEEAGDDEEAASPPQLCRQEAVEDGEDDSRDRRSGVCQSDRQRAIPVHPTPEGDECGDVRSRAAEIPEDALNGQQSFKFDDAYQSIQPSIHTYIDKCVHSLIQPCHPSVHPPSIYPSIIPSSVHTIPIINWINQSFNQSINHQLIKQSRNQATG